MATSPRTEPTPAPPTPVEPSNSGTDADWYACTVASDCVLVGGVCGSSVGANRAHAAEVAAQQDALAALASCAAPTGAERYQVDCFAGVCTAILDPLPEAES